MSNETNVTPDRTVIGMRPEDFKRWVDDGYPEPTTPTPTPVKQVMLIGEFGALISVAADQTERLLANGWRRA